MPESLTPPQGLIAVTDRRPIYGYPLGLGVGGGGTKVRVSLPPVYAQGSGMIMRLIGSYAPAVRPPVVEHPLYSKQYPGGMRVFVIPEAEVMRPVCSAGCRAVVIPDAEIIKCRQGSGQCPASVEVVSI